MWGYIFQIAPDALLDDGFFEVVVMKDAPKWQYFAVVPSSLNGKIYDAEFVEHFRSRRVKIYAEGKNYVHLDGEGFINEGALEFEIKPKALKILVPHE